MKRNKFSLSHYKLLTGEMGELLPCGLMEVLPGDTFQHSSQALIRLAPMSAPVMHPIVARIHHFFVPHRLVFSGWEDFITGESETGPTTRDAYTPPAGSVADYHGLEPGVEHNSVSNLAELGYTEIWNEFYRDQDLDAVDTGAYGSDPKKIAWEKDYFTAARPWEQKGDAVTLPLGTSAPVVTNNTPFEILDGSSNESNLIAASSSTMGGQSANWNTSDLLRFGSESGLTADLTNATPANITALREAFALQRYAEARARYGSRYTEYLRYLGVTPDDARLQRPEYLGGGRALIQTSEVMQTAPETGQTPSNDFGVGDMYGHGVAAIGGRPYRRFFSEHGYIHSLLSLRPKALYGNSVPRHFLKTTKEDYWQKELQHIGQQEVYNEEVYADHATPTGVFGYNDRYSEYRSMPSSIAGDFRSTLNHWHQGRIFSSDPSLNDTFVKCDPTNRIFNVQTGDNIWCMVHHKVKARRLVSRSGAPRL